MQHEINCLFGVSRKMRLPESLSIESVEVVLGKEVGNGRGRRAKA